MLDRGPGHVTQPISIEPARQTGETGMLLARPVEVLAPESARPGVIGPLIEASKPGITRLVTITSGVGFGMAIAQGPSSWRAAWTCLLASLLGTAISSSGANTLNQWWERERDARMRRTERRPLPRGALTPRTVLASGLILSALGVAVLWAFCGAAPALVSLTTIATYLLVYTPLKPVTPWSTLVGAFPGALPPLIGWSSAASLSGTRAGFESLTHPLGLSLFLILFVWQVPHTLAIAWMYKDDYARGGHRLLPVIDGDGRRTARWMLAWSVVLLPVSLAPAYWMRPGAAAAFVIIAAIMGVAYFWLALRVVRTRERADARRMFFASIMHLPLLLVSLVGFTLVTSLF